MPRIFISYRRDDSLTVTGRLHDHLVAAFGGEHVFKDVDDIPLGVDFRRVVEREVSACDVLLVIIGASWLTVTDESGRRRLDQPEDFVRVEVEEGLKRPSVLVVPVLVHGASMPGSAELPDSLRELAFRNAAIVRDDPDFSRDMQRLIAKISRHQEELAPQTEPASAPPPVYTETVPQTQPIARPTETTGSAPDERRVSQPEPIPARESRSSRSSLVGLFVLVLILATAGYLAFRIIDGEDGTTLACGGSATGTITANNFAREFTIQSDDGAPLMVSMYRSEEGDNPLHSLLQLIHPAGELFAEDNDSALEGNARLVLPGLPGPGTYTLIASREGMEEGDSEGSFVVRSYCEPKPILCNSVVSGQISNGNPIDWWVLEAEPGLHVVAKMFKSEEGNLDPFLFVHAPEGWKMTWDDDSLENSNAMVEFGVEAPGPYSILATRYEGERGNTNGFYELEILCEGGEMPQQQQ